jgi:hypothetical protein
MPPPPHTRAPKPRNSETKAIVRIESYRIVPSKMKHAVLFFAFCLFGFVALVFEPLYYFGCDWNGLVCTNACTSSLIDAVRNVWLIYAAWDPIFLDIPLWLRVLCSIEVFIFGPLYVVVAVGLWTRGTWLRIIAQPFCGALIYSTFVYFAMEYLESVPNTNFLLVFLVNIPWTIVPAWLLWELSGESKAKTALVLRRLRVHLVSSQLIVKDIGRCFQQKV